MIILIALFSWWFSCLSTLPQQLMIWFKDMEFSDATQFIIINILRLISCEKCLALWIAIGYFSNETRHFGYTLLYAGLTSLTAMVSARIYYKTLS